MLTNVTTTIAGNLVEDPELRFTPSGAAVVKFRVASTPRYLDKATNEWKDGEATFLTVNQWRGPAEERRREPDQGNTGGRGRAPAAALV